MNVRMQIEIEFLERLKGMAGKAKVAIDLLNVHITLGKITDDQLLDLRAMIVVLDQPLGDVMHDIDGFKTDILNPDVVSGFSPRSYEYNKKLLQPVSESNTKPRTIDQPGFVELGLSPLQIAKLKHATEANGEPPEQYPLLAQVMLNEAINDLQQEDTATTGVSDVDKTGSYAGKQHVLYCPYCKAINAFVGDLWPEKCQCDNIECSKTFDVPPLSEVDQQ